VGFLKVAGGERAVASPIIAGVTILAEIDRPWPWLWLKLVEENKNPVTFRYRYAFSFSFSVHCFFQQSSLYCRPTVV